MPTAVIGEHRTFSGEPRGDRVPEMAVHRERVHQYRGARSSRIAVHAVADGGSVAHAREALRDLHPRANLAHTSRTPSWRSFESLWMRAAFALKNAFATALRSPCAPCAPTTAPACARPTAGFLRRRSTCVSSRLRRTL